MPARHISFHVDPATRTDPTGGGLATRFAQVRAELDVPGEFSAAALAEAERAAQRSLPALPDLTDLPWWTLDPPGSMDLDQAMALGRDGEGYVVHYAIADVPAFVTPGGALDREVRLRGQTIYLPDGRIPLHPKVISEAAASLLPGQVRPAYVWEFVLDGAAQVRSVSVARSLVRSRVRRDYAEVQALVDDGQADEDVTLLREIGTQRAALEAARGGASLPMPEQEVVEVAPGDYRLELRPPRASEDWNAQISLMTGMAAAEMMLAGGVGLLRTMPGPDPSAVARFRRQARALGVPWEQGRSYGDFLRSLDRTQPRHLALIHEATSLFRGAGYTPFHGQLPELRTHAAVAAPYAHVTAPLRRLVDRFGLVVCEALSAGHPVPQWAVEALPQVPDLMATSDRRASAVERASTDAVEAAVVSSHIGAVFRGTVVDETSKGQPIVQLVDVAVVAVAKGSARPGTDVRIRVAGADVAAGRVTLEIIPSADARVGSGGAPGAAS